MTLFFWILAMLGALVGSITLVSAFAADSAPKQAAAAAMAAALAVIPYCLARAISELSSSTAVVRPKAIEHVSPVIESKLTWKQVFKGVAIIALVVVIGIALYALRILYP